jgi:cytochrome P450
MQDAKICFSDDTLPDGYSVRKGDMVSYQPYAMGRMKFIWGDDAEEFRPERWLDENGIFQPESPFKFTAFQVSTIFLWTCNVYLLYKYLCSRAGNGR